MSRFVAALLLVAVTSFKIIAADPAKPADDEAALFKTASSLYDGIKSITLANGLKVYLKPIPGCPIVTTMMAYRVGACDEELSRRRLDTDRKSTRLNSSHV